jgi:hypothetical protein
VWIVHREVAWVKEKNKRKRKKFTLSQSMIEAGREGTKKGKEGRLGKVAG